MVIINFLILAVGIVLILLGADTLTGAASAIARRLKVSELVIGLTVVAMGTSMPEFVVSVISSIENKPELAIGNVVGSNLFNTLVILGATALLCPIKITRQVIAKDIPWSILTSIILLVVASGVYLNGDANNQISRQSGMVLLCIFVTFLYYTLLIAKNEKSTPTEGDKPIKEKPLWMSLLLILVGLFCLVNGGNLFVESASKIAFEFGMSESLVGLTIVSIGTSIPELATSLVAARKQKVGMAVGNVIGSNIFNILLILGASATITPLKLGNITTVDLVAQLACCVLVWIFSRTSYTLSRKEGAVLILTYGVYLSYLIMGA